MYMCVDFKLHVLVDNKSKDVIGNFLKILICYQKVQNIYYILLD